MLANYKDILKRVLVHEGGFVNNAKDPGGATMKGVTQAVYNAFRDLHDLPRRSVRHLEQSELEAIYDRQYWDKVAGDALPSGIDYAVFDGAVNSGVGQAVKWLQRELKVRGLYDGLDDGIIGLKTLAGLRKLNDHAAVIKGICARRLAFMRTIKHKKTGRRLWLDFGDGWTARVTGVKSHAVTLATSSAGPTMVA